MKWIAVGPLAALPEDEIVPFAQDGGEWILVRKGNAVSAFVDLCSHQEIKLSEFGEIQRGILICHAHGAAFDCHDGKDLCFPATAPLLRVPLRVISGMIEIQI